MNTVEELKTDGAGRRVTAGDWGYCNFGNQAQLYSKCNLRVRLSSAYLLHGMHISTAIFEEIFTET